jgi:hypothetical protein
MEGLLSLENKMEAVTNVHLRNKTTSHFNFEWDLLMNRITLPD